MKRGLANVEINATGCHVYCGCLLPNGYAKVGKDGKTWLGHRLAWTLANGPIPDGQMVLHKCDNRACVNPAHLFLGSARDNTQDMVRKGRGKFPGARNPQRGTDRYNAKLDERSVRLMRRLSLFTLSEMAQIFGVTFQTVSSVRRGRHWSWVRS